MWKNAVNLDSPHSLCECAYLQDVRSWFLDGMSEAEEVEESLSNKALSLTVPSQRLTDLGLIGFPSHLQKTKNKQTENHLQHLQSPL